MKHLLGIKELTRQDVEDIINLGEEMKRDRGNHEHQPLRGQTWALIFSKASTRTRVSFEVGIRELGGEVIFISNSVSQLGRGEPIRDTARVFGRMTHGAVIRTFDQQDIVEFAEFSHIPTINALTDEEHPCQILGDLMTIKQIKGRIDDLVITFIGDGDCNVARSWIYAADLMEFQLRVVAPKEFQPPQELLDGLKNDNVRVTDDLDEGILASDVLYTDVWVSMGKEEEAKERLEILKPYQINEAMLNQAAPDATVLHCLPAYREKEISNDVFEAHATHIFDQAENRLHIQKGVICWLLR
jgi:ornithine carbamoyltransferase